MSLTGAGRYPSGFGGDTPTNYDCGVLLTTREVATFVAQGYLRFESIVPEEINGAAIDEMAQLASERLAPDGMKPPHTGTPLAECYPPPSAIGEYLRLPRIRGIVDSLVGPAPLFDHDWTHHIPAGTSTGQLLHVDAVADTAWPAFDIQLFWFPEEVGPSEGGTRFVPGTHLTQVRASGIGRYQHIAGEQDVVCPAGSVFVFHHGLWHAGRPNPGGRDRWMHKVRLNPTAPQVRRWDTSDLDALHNPPSDHVFARMMPDSVAQIFRTYHPWMSISAYRNDQMQRARLWRYLTGDDTYDVDHYLTRIEHRAELVGRAADPTTGPS